MDSTPIIDYNKDIVAYSKDLDELKKAIERLNKKKETYEEKMEECQKEIKECNKEMNEFRKMLIETSDKEKKESIKFILESKREDIENYNKNIEYCLRLIELKEKEKSSIREEIQRYKSKIESISSSVIPKFVTVSENSSISASEKIQTSESKSSTSISLRSISKSSNVSFSKFGDNHALAIMESFELSEMLLLISFWSDEFKRRKMCFSPESAQNLSSIFVWPKYAVVNGKETNGKHSNGEKTDEKVEEKKMSEKDAMPYIFEWLFDNINNMWCQYYGTNLEELSYKFRLVFSITQSLNSIYYKFWLTEGFSGSTDIMILSDNGCTRFNLVNIEIKSCKDSVKKGYGQTIAQLISANSQSMYPVMQFTTDMQQIFEIRIILKYEGAFMVGKWSVSMKQALNLIVFWLKFVQDEFKYKNGKAVPPKSKFFKAIYDAHQHTKSKRLNIKNLFENLIEDENSEFEENLNEMRKNYNYLNFNERCLKWLNSECFYSKVTKKIIE